MEMIDKWKDNVNKKRKNNDLMLKMMVDFIIKVRNKNKCFDMFWNIKLGDSKMYKALRI